MAEAYKSDSKVKLLKRAKFRCYYAGEYGGCNIPVLCKRQVGWGSHVAPRNSQDASDDIELIKRLLDSMETTYFDLMRSNIKKALSAQEISGRLEVPKRYLLKYYLDTNVSRGVLANQEYLGLIRWLLLAFSPRRVWEVLAEDMKQLSVSIRKSSENGSLSNLCTCRRHVAASRVGYYMNVLLEHHEFDMIGGPQFRASSDKNFDNVREAFQHRQDALNNFAASNLCHVSYMFLPSDMYSELRETLWQLQQCNRDLKKKAQKAKLWGKTKKDSDGNVIPTVCECVQSFGENADASKPHGPVRLVTDADGNTPGGILKLPKKFRDGGSQGSQVES